jgi:hypothetical protein
MSQRRLLFMALLAMIALLSALAADAKTSVFRLAAPDKTARPKEKDVELMGMNHKPKRGHALAVLTANSPAPHGVQKVDLRYWTDDFRPDAAKLGANAVVGIHWIPAEDRKSYTATGIAIEYSDSTFIRPCQCVIAIPKPTNTSNTKEGMKKDDDESLQKLLAVELERKGYYAIAFDQAFSSPQTFPVAPLSEHLGLPVDLVFVSNLTFDHESNSPHLRGMLVRMATGDTVWSTAPLDSAAAARAAGMHSANAEIKSRAGYIGTEVGKVLQTLPAPPGVGGP